jgi:hypothetical protein
LLNRLSDDSKITPVAVANDVRHGKRLTLLAKTAFESGDAVSENAN